MKKVSIITPMYNSEKYLSETIESVLKQTYTNWEMILIDDGSSDNSIQIAENYRTQDERIVVYKRMREPKGVSTCRNIGIENAKGEYLLFLDSDDLLTETCIENRVQYMIANPNLDFAIFQMLRFNENGIIPNSQATHIRENYLYAFLSSDFAWTVTTPIWNIDFLRKNNFTFNEQYIRLEDPELMTKVLLMSNVRFDVLTSDTYIDCYYRNPINKKVNLKNALTSHLYFLQDFSSLTNNRIDIEKCRKCLQNHYNASFVCLNYSTFSQRKQCFHIAHKINKIAKQNNIIPKTTYIFKYIELNTIIKYNILYPLKKIYRFVKYTLLHSPTKYY
ncbi:MAG: glycosyltransferase [Bacteroidales bacterium]|jgi:glycosyltransferase involved in cell wall biosynthesis|nr:glycosyltransferase [Bacteroidales bacterium]